MAAIALVALAVPASAQSSSGPTLDLTRTSGSPGQPLIIHGTGFPPGEVVALYIDRPDPYLYLNPPPGPRADARGEFTDSLKWPGSFYDQNHRIDPSKPGMHLVCGDTGYPGSAQPVAAKACAEFTVLGGPSPAPTFSDQLPSLPLPWIGAAIAIVIALAVAGQWWMQRQARSR